MKYIVAVTFCFLLSLNFCEADFRPSFLESTGHFKHNRTYTELRGVPFCQYIDIEFFPSSYVYDPNRMAAKLTIGGLSDQPIGVRSYHSVPESRPGEVGQLNLVSCTNFESVFVTAMGVSGESIGAAKDFSVRASRLSLAKYAADKRIRAGASQTVNGRSLAGFTAQKSNVNFVRFADWATARGIQYTYDSAKCTISFTRNGKSVLLPIAAKAVRVNGTWRDLPDIVMISPDREERTLVPVALDALTN